MDNLELWRSVEKTDPAATKQFAGKGGFRGTAISPMYLIKKATEVWGPMGDRWGVRISSAQVIDGAPLLGKDGIPVGHEKLYVVQALVYYPGKNGLGEVPCFGQTILCGQRKGGEFYTDEEAPKKSLTDALTKGLSWLGFAADVHMGRYDDSKYVSQVQREMATASSRDVRETAMLLLRSSAARGIGALEGQWKLLTAEQRKACQDDLPSLKKEAQSATST
jgi:hypothetical protein